MRTFQTLTQGKKSLFFPGPGLWCQAEARGWEGRGRRPEGWGQRLSDSAGQAALDTHTALLIHLKMCVPLAYFCLFTSLQGRTGGRLMKKVIKFGKNPKPNSIHLPTWRPYIIPQGFSSCPPLRLSSFLPPSLAENTGNPRNASF